MSPFEDLLIESVSLVLIIFRPRIKDILSYTLKIPSVTFLLQIINPSATASPLSNEVKEAKAKGLDAT